MNKRLVIKRYSIAFKQQVVTEYENGATVYQLQKKYGITGATTVQSWVQKYGREGLRHKLMTIQSPDDQNRQKELEERIKLLEKTIVDLHVENTILRAYAEVEKNEEVKNVSKKNAPNS